RTRRLMRILGVDPGLTRCGIGVIDTLPARKVKMIAVDVLRTPSADSVDLRLGAIAEAFDTSLDTHRPDMVALERVFARNDVYTIMGTVQVSGLTMGLAELHGLPVTMTVTSVITAEHTFHARHDLY